MMPDIVTEFHVFHYATHSWVWGVITVVAPVVSYLVNTFTPVTVGTWTLSATRT